MWRGQHIRFLLVIVLAGIFIPFLFVNRTNAAVGINQQLSFEGKIVKSDGTNIPDGTYNMEFKIYSGGTATGGGTLKWTEDWLDGGSGGVTFNSGTFQANLGSINAFGASVDWNSNPLYLSLQIGNTSNCTISTTFQSNCSGDGEMSPYILLTAVPYAFNSNELNGLQSSAFGQLSANQTWTGANTLQPATNSTALVVKQNSTASPTTDIFDVQTANGTGVIQVTGPSLNNASVSIASVGASNALNLSSGTGTVQIASNVNIASGDVYEINGVTLCSSSGCTPSSGANNYIQNGTGLQSSSNFNISGVGEAGTSFEAPAIDTAVSGALSIGGTNATAINLNQNTTVASGKSFNANGTAVVQNGSADSTTEFQVNAKNGTNLFNVNTINNLVGTAATSTASTNSSALSIQTGNATGTTSNSGNLSLDTGTATGTVGTITIAGTNATNVTIGRSGVQISVPGGISTGGGAIATGGGNLTLGAGTITSGAINGQTISSTASFTGTVAIAGANALSLGTSSSNTGAIVLKGSGGTGTLTLAGPTTPNTGNFTLSLPAVAANDTVCTNTTQATACSNYAAVSGDGNYIENQVGQQSSSNFNISGTGIAGVSFLAPLLGTSNVSSASTASANLIVQSGNATGTGPASVSGNVTVDSGSSTSGVPGTLNLGTTNAPTVNIGNGSGTTTVGVSCGTGNCNFGSNATAHTTNVGSTNSTSTTNLGGGTGGINIGTAGIANTVQIGNTSGGVAQTINIGNNSTGGSTNTVVIGSTIAGNITLQSAATISVGNNAAAQTINVGNSTGATALNEVVGTGNYTLNGVGASTYTLGAATTTGTFSIGGTAETGTITLGSSSGTNIVAVGNGAGATTVNIANANAAGAVSVGGAFTTGTISIGGSAESGTITLGASSATNTENIATGAGNTTLNIANNASAANATTLGSTNSGSTTKLQAGATSESLSNTGDTIQTSTNSATALQVENAAGTTALDVNSTNNNVSTNTLAPPGQPTGTPSTSGGTLAIGTYFYKITALDGLGGQTTASVESSVVNTTTNTSSIALTWAVSPGAHSYRVYRGTTSGGENVYYTVYTNSYTDTGATNTSASPPTTNNAFNDIFSSGSNAQINVGTNGTPVGQVYIGGNIPTSAIATSTTGTNPISVAVQGRYVYIINETSATLQVFDISNPALKNPPLLSTTATGAAPFDISVAGQFAYVTCFTTGTLQIFNITNPSSPALVGSVFTTGISDPLAVSVVGRYAYVLNFNSSNLQIYDISKPASAVQVSSIATAANPSFVYIQGRYAYVSDYGSSTFQIFDISNPLSPTQVTTGSGVSTNGANPYAVTVSGGYAYVVNDVGSSLAIFNVTNPASPSLVSTTATGTNPVSIAVQDRYAYITNYGSGTLQVFDVSNPNAPASLGSVTAGTNARSVAILGRYAYVANYGSANFQTFDIGGEYAQQLEAGGIEAGSINVDTNEAVGGSSSIQGGLQVGGTAQVSSDFGVGGNATIQGTSSLLGGILGGGSFNALATPGTPTVTPQGTTGAATWKYTIVAVGAGGGTTAASAAGQTTTGNATLTSGNFNAVTWTAVPGAASYNVYRTVSGGTPATTGLVGSGITVTSFNDTGIAGGAAAPAIDTSGQLVVNGPATFKNTANSSAAFLIDNAGGTALLTANTSSTQIVIGAGSAGEATPVLLVLDNSTTASDPTETDGAMYYNDSTENFRCGEAGSWVNCLNGLISSNTAGSAAVANTTTATNFSVNSTLPANYCVAGRVITIHAGGIVESAGFGLGNTPGLSFAVLLGATTVATTPSMTQGQAATVLNWTLEFTMICRAAPSAASAVAADGFITIDTATNAVNAYVLGTNPTVNIATNAAQTINIQVTWNHAAANDTITLENLTVSGT